MAKRKNNSDDVIKGLIGLPALAVFFAVFKTSHSVVASCLVAGGVIGIGIGVMVVVGLTRQERLKKSGIHDIDKMDGRQFECYLGHLFKSQGYSVQVTRASGDFGADLVLSKDGQKIVVQAKRHSKNIGLKAVQEAQASIAHYKAHEAWVVSNRHYTEEAQTLARANGVRLIHRDELISMILRMNPQVVSNPKQVIASLPPKDITCDSCGKPMVLRKSAKGEFYGCSGYPRCRNIKQVKSDAHTATHQ